MPVETKSDDAAAATVTDAQASGNAALAEAQAENTASIQHFTVVPDAEGLPSDEELFQGYAEGVLYGNTAATFGIAAGKTLTGDVKLAYDALVPVLKQIASGERANATISVGHDLGTVTSQDGTVLGTYNAEVDASFTGTTFGDDEMHELLSALLADLPYDLYWFDKVAGFTASIVATTGTETTPGEMYLSFNFYVSKVYQGGSNLTVNASLTGAASKAAANAKDLVDEIQKLYDSDCDILRDYKDWICYHVSYDSDAASSNGTGGFQENSDPWQVIYVFDDDPETNVVCEGYSKAFQYLCDLTTFHDSSTECYSVTGTLTHPGGSGPHMWNIVKLDGKSYLADVTNSDADTAGEDGSLFLVGGSPNADGSYTFGSCTFTYDEDTTSLWSSGNTLTLSASSYASSTTFDQAALEEALSTRPDGEFYDIPQSLTLTDNLNINTIVADSGYGWQVRIPDGVTLTVPAGKTLKLEGNLGIAEGGALVVEAGGALVLGESTTWGEIYLNGGTLSIADGATLTINSGNVTVDLTCATNSLDAQIPSDHLRASAYVSSEDQLREVLSTNYPVHNIAITTNIAITSNLTLNSGDSISLYMGTLTVNDGCTLNIQDSASIWVDLNAVLENNGAIIVAENGSLQGTGSLSNNGTIEGNYSITPPGSSQLTEEQFQAALESAIESNDGFYSLTEQVTISSDFTIPEGCTVWVQASGSLTVAEGGKLTVSGQLSTSYSSITVNGTLVNDGIITLDFSGDGGSITVSETGTLENNRYIDIMSGALTVEGAYTPGEEVTLGWNSTSATITGVDAANITISAIAEMEDELTDALVPKTGYAHQQVLINDNIALTKDLTIPESISLTIGYCDANQPCLTVPDGITLTNNSSINICNYSSLEIQPKAELLNNGIITLAGTLTNSGTVVSTTNGMLIEMDGCVKEGEGTYITKSPEGTMTQEEFEAAVADAGESGSYELAADVTLSSNYTIPNGIEIHVADGFTLTVAEGATLTIPGAGYLVSPAYLTTTNGHIDIYGTLTNNGTVLLDRDSTDGTILVGATGQLTNNDTLKVLGGTLTVNGGYTQDPESMVSYIAYDPLHASINGGTIIASKLIDLDILASTEAELRQAVELEGYGNHAVRTAGEFQLSQSLEVPEGVTVSIGFSSYGDVAEYLHGLTVPAGVTITNHGEISVTNTGYLHVSEGAYFDNQGYLYINGQFLCSGRLDGPVDGPGEISGIDTYENLLAKLERSQNTGSFETLEGTVQLRDNLDIAMGTMEGETATLYIDGTLIVPAGTTLTITAPVVVNGSIEVSGTVKVSGSLEICSDFGGTVLIREGGTLVKAGGTITGTVTYTESHETYLSCYSLGQDENTGEWYEVENGDPWRIEGLEALAYTHVIFYLNQWDEINYCWTKTPVLPTSSNSNYCSITRLGSMDGEAIREGETNSYYFVFLKTQNTLGGETLSLYANGQTFPFTIYSLTAGFFTSADTSFETYVGESYQLISGEENAFYLALCMEDATAEVDLTIFPQEIDFDALIGGDLLTQEEVVEGRVWKFTVNPDFVNYARYDGKNFVAYAEMTITLADGDTCTYTPCIVVNPPALTAPDAILHFGTDSYLICGEDLVLRLHPSEDNPDLYVQDPSELPDGVSYDLHSNTLTLTNVTEESLSLSYMTDWEDLDTGETWTSQELPNADLTIRLVGSNTLTGVQDWGLCIAGGTNVTIEGDGDLTLKAEEGHNLWALFVDTDSSIHFKSGSITADSAYVSLLGKTVWEGTAFRGAGTHLLLSGGESDGASFQMTGGSITLTDGPYIDSNGQPDTCTAVLESNVPTCIDGGSITIRNGALRNENAGTLTLNGGSITIENDRNHVNLVGVENFGTLTVNGGTLNSSVVGGYGIWNSGTLTQAGGTVNAAAEGAAALGTVGTLQLSGGEMNLSGYDGLVQEVASDDTPDNYDLITRITGGKLAITAAERGIVTANGSVFIAGRVDAGQYVAPEITIDAETAIYNLSDDPENSDFSTDSDKELLFRTEDGSYLPLTATPNNDSYLYTVMDGSAVIGKATVAIRGAMTQAEFVSAMQTAAAAGSTYVLTDAVTVSSDMALVCDVQIADDGKLTIAEGCTLEIPYNCALTVDAAGQVVVNGSLDNNGTLDSSGRVTITGTLDNFGSIATRVDSLLTVDGKLKNEPGAYLTVNGVYELGVNEFGQRALIQIFLDSATDDYGFTNIPMEDLYLVTTIADWTQLVTAANAMDRGYAYGDIEIVGDLDVTGDVLLPGNVTVWASNETEETLVVTVEEGCTVTCCGLLSVSGNVLIQVNGELQLDGDGCVETLDGAILAVGSAAPAGISLFDASEPAEITARVVVGTGTRLDVTTGTCAVGSDAEIIVSWVNGYTGTVNGVPNSDLTLQLAVSEYNDISGFEGMCQKMTAEEYKNAQIVFPNNYILTQDLTIPAGVEMIVEEYGTVLVGDGVTLTNEGSIRIPEGSTLTVMGELDGSGETTGNGVLDDAPDTDQELFQAELDKAAEEAAGMEEDEMATVVLDRRLVLDSNLTIPRKVVVLIDSGAIEVPEGVTLTINGCVNVYGYGRLDVLSGGKLVNNGEIGVYTDPAYGRVLVDGTYTAGSDATFWVSFPDGSTNTVTGIPKSKQLMLGSIFGDEAGSNAMLQSMLSAATTGYRWTYINLIGGTLTGNVTVPSKASLSTSWYYYDGNMYAPPVTIQGNLVVNGELWIDEGCELINEGTITVNKGGYLIDFGTYSGPAPRMNGGRIVPQAAKVTISAPEDVRAYDVATTTECLLTVNVASVDSSVNTLQRVTWTSSNKNIVDPAKIEFVEETDAGAVYRVTFKKAVGSVKLVATSIDGNRKAASITLSTYYRDPATKLKASFDSALPSIGLQPGEERKLQISGTNLLDATYLKFTSSNTAIAEVAPDGTITGGSKTGTAKITATLVGDPLKRYVTVSVKVVPPQVTGLTLNPSEVALDLDDLTDTASRTVMITADATGAYGEPKISLKWSSSDTSLATVTATSSTSAKVTIKAGAYGAFTITAVSNDLLKTSASTQIVVRNYTPRLAASSFTLNSYLESGVSAKLLPGYDNGITGVTLYEYNSKTRTYAEEPSSRFTASYDDNSTLTIGTADVVSNGTYNLLMKVATENGRTYEFKLKAVVKNALPSVSVKQSSKFNLFYKDSTAPLVIASSGRTIDSVTLKNTNDFVLNGDGNLEFSQDYRLAHTRAADTKATLEIKVSGCRVPVTKSLTISTTTVRPSLSLTPASSTVNTALGQKETSMQLWNKTEGAYMDICQMLVFPASNASFANMDLSDAKTLTLELKGTTGGTATLWVQDSNWMSSIKLTHKVSVTSKLPTLKLGTTTLKLNRYFTEKAASTSVALSQSNVAIADMTFATTSLEGQKLNVSYENGQIVARIDPASVPKAGTYTFTGTATLEGTEKTVKTTFKISVSSSVPSVKLSTTYSQLNTYLAGNEVLSTNVSTASGYTVVSFLEVDEGTYNSKFLLDFKEGMLSVSLADNTLKAGTYTLKLTPIVQQDGTLNEVTLPSAAYLKVKVYTASKLGVSLSAKGTLNTMNPGSYIQYTAKLTNCIGPVTGVTLVGADADLFEAELISGGTKPVVRLTTKEGAQYSTRITYKVQLQFETCGTTITSSAISIRISQSALRLTATSALYYQAQSTPVSTTVSLTSPVSAEIQSIELNSKTSKELIAALGNKADAMSWKFLTDNNRKAQVDLKITNPGRLVAGRSYSLYLNVTPKGCASNVSATVVKLTVKVAK